MSLLRPLSFLANVTQNGSCVWLKNNNRKDRAGSSVKCNLYPAVSIQIQQFACATNSSWTHSCLIFRQCYGRNKQKLRKTCMEEQITALPLVTATLHSTTHLVVLQFPNRNLCQHRLEVRQKESISYTVLAQNAQNLQTRTKNSLIVKLFVTKIIATDQTVMCKVTVFNVWFYSGPRPTDIFGGIQNCCNFLSRGGGEMILTCTNN